jgi:hypothetical protein
MQHPIKENGYTRMLSNYKCEKFGKLGVCRKRCREQERLCWRSSPSIELEPVRRGGTRALPEYECTKKEVQYPHRSQNSSFRCCTGSDGYRPSLSRMRSMRCYEAFEGGATASHHEDHLGQSREDHRLRAVDVARCEEELAPTSSRRSRQEVNTSNRIRMAFGGMEDLLLTRNYLLLPHTHLVID